MIKRLAGPLPAPGGHIKLDMLNPPRRLSIPASHILAVHGFVSVAKPGGEGLALVPRSALNGEDC